MECPFANAPFSLFLSTYKIAWDIKKKRKVMFEFDRTLQEEKA